MFFLSPNCETNMAWKILNAVEKAENSKGIGGGKD